MAPAANGALPLIRENAPACSAGASGGGALRSCHERLPWTSLITAVVPAAAVLALTGRQNNQAGRTAALKTDYAGFVQAVTALIEHREPVSRAGESQDALEARAREAAARDADAQLVSAVERARAVVDLAGSYGARSGAFLVSVQADMAGQPGTASELAAALEEFLKAVSGEVGGESRPGLKWKLRMTLRRN